jgi:hypothetical protein
MPEATVKLPNGRTVIVRGDSQASVMARIEQVRAENQNDPNRNVWQGEGPSPGIRQAVNDLNPIQAGFYAAGSAVNDVVENIGRLGYRAGEAMGLVSPEQVSAYDSRATENDNVDRAMVQERPVATGIGRTAGQIGMFAAVPGGVQGSLAARMATGALAGATTAALSTGVDENPYTNFAIGAGFGAGAPILINGVSLAVRKLAKKPIQVMVDGKFTDEALDFLQRSEIEPGTLNREVATELRRVGALTREQAERFNLFQQFDPNMNPTMAQLTQTADDFKRQQELFKSSGVVREVLDNQDRIIKANVDQWIESTGGVTRDSMDAGTAVSGAINARINAADQAVDAVYAAAREALSDNKVIRPSNLGRTLNAFRSDDNATQGLLSAVKGDLVRRGIMTESGRIQGRISADVAESVRQNINALISENPSARSRVGRALKDAFDEDVAAAVGDDLFKPARAAKSALERSLERARVNRRDVGADTLLENLISNRSAPEVIVPQILRRTTRVQDVRQMMAFLESGSAQDIANGRQAIAELRSAVIRELYEKAASGKAETGDLLFSGKAFARQLDAIGQSKLEAIFDQETLVNLGRLRRIGELRTPVTGTALGLGPSGQGMLAGAREIGSRLMNNADEQTRMFVNLTRILTRTSQDVSDISRMVAPAQTTEAGIRAASEIRRIPVSGSVGAVTADRLQMGSEE